MKYITKSPIKKLLGRLLLSFHCGLYHNGNYLLLPVICDLTTPIFDMINNASRGSSGHDGESFSTLSQDSGSEMVSMRLLGLNCGTTAKVHMGISRHISRQVSNVT